MADTKKQREYTADKIQVLKGLDAVRMRPGMYIGSTGSRGLHHLLWEIVDNAMDEAANGYCDKIEVTINKDNSVTVTDHGRGIPIEINKVMNIPGVQVVFTQLHAGGKFNYENYSYSGGLHGVGASVVNALSRWLEVEVRIDGKKYHQRYESIESNEGKIESGKPVTKLKEIGTTNKKGSSITFMPDDRVFSSTEFNKDTVEKRLMELAFLNPGVKIYFTDLREGTKSDKKEFNFSGGIGDFVKYINEDKKVLFNEPINITGNKDGIKADIAIQYTDSYSDSILSYVNNIPTTEGGTHETGFKSGFTKVMNEYARRLGVLSDKSGNLSGDDFREGMTAIVSIKMRDIQFEGQTKTKLGNPEARTAIEQIVQEALGNYMDNHENFNITKSIAEKAIQAAKVREAARKA